jgi:AraC family transcriptional regulator
VNAKPGNRNQDAPIVFKRKAAWEGIWIEHDRNNGGELPEHNHRYHEMLIAIGAGCNGELRTANGFRLQSYRGARGVCMIPAGIAHRAQLSGISEHLAIFLDPTIVTRAANEADILGTVEVMEKFSESDPVIRNVGMALLAESQSKRLGGRLYVDSLANVLAVHLLRNYTVAGKVVPHHAGGLSGRKLREVTIFMEQNCMRDLHLEELALVAGISRFHFAHEFKRMTGASPHQYLMKVRIEHAKTLLKRSALPLVEVGLRSGFSHQSHFTRLFRRFTGTTPQSYRLLVQR